MSALLWISFSSIVFSSEAIKQLFNFYKHHCETRKWSPSDKKDHRRRDKKWNHPALNMETQLSVVIINTAGLAHITTHIDHFTGWWTVWAVWPDLVYLSCVDALKVWVCRGSVVWKKASHCAHSTQKVRSSGVCQSRMVLDVNGSTYCQAAALFHSALWDLQ